MIYIGIDPGNEQTAVVSIDGQRNVIEHFKCLNSDLETNLSDILCGNRKYYTVGIECVACYGMAVGASLFETAEWCGRIRCFLSSWVVAENIYRVYRKQVKMHLCGQTKAKDPNVRQALIDLYPADGGGANPQVGTKSKPGPLYGFSADQWAALGVAITTLESKSELTLFT